MCSRENPDPSHQLLLGDQCTYWQSSSQSLCRCDHVWNYSKVFYGKPLSCPSDSALDFVVHEKNSVFLETAEELPEVVIWGYHVASLSLNRLDEKGCDFFWRDVLVKELLLDEIDAGEAAVRILQLQGAPVTVGVWNVVNTGKKRRKTLHLGRFARSEREGTHGPSVKTAVES